jgi:hypothetical protein
MHLKIHWSILKNKVGQKQILSRHVNTKTAKIQEKKKCFTLSYFDNLVSFNCLDFLQSRINEVSLKANIVDWVQIEQKCWTFGGYNKQSHMLIGINPIALIFLHMGSIPSILMGQVP